MREGVLKNKFNRLFRINEQREVKICEMGYWGPSGWVWELKWSRELRGRGATLAIELISNLNRSIFIKKRRTYGAGSRFKRVFFGQGGVFKTGQESGSCWSE